MLQLLQELSQINAKWYTSIIQMCHRSCARVMPAVFQTVCKNCTGMIFGLCQIESLKHARGLPKVGGSYAGFMHTLSQKYARIMPALVSALAN